MDDRTRIVKGELVWLSWFVMAAEFILLAFGTEVRGFSSIEHARPSCSTTSQGGEGCLFPGCSNLIADILSIYKVNALLSKSGDLSYREGRRLPS